MTTPTTALRDVIEALEPCPFCGHDDSLYIEHVDGTILHPAYYVRCDYCGAQSGATDTGNHIKQWNTRVHSATLLRALAVMEAVEAAPVGEVGYICRDDAGAECHVYRHERFDDSLLDKRVRLVLDGEG